MPNATVATMTSASSRANAFCASARSSSLSPAWYARACTPFRRSHAVRSSTLLRDRQYTIPLSPRCFLMTARMSVRVSRPTPFFWVVMMRLGRKNEPLNPSGLRMPSCRMMSPTTWRVAVAVRARIGMSPNCDFSPASCRYAGRKSWPQWLMQWASSTTMRLIRDAASAPRSPSPRPSGAAYTMSSSPARSFASVACRSSQLSVELRSAARKPVRTSASTWSFMSEMSGERTRTGPSRIFAGIWKVRLLPAPVGMSPMQSRPASTASMIFRWPGRNSSKPNTVRSTSSGSVNRCLGSKTGAPTDTVS